MVFGHKVQTFAISRYQARKWAVKESSCVPFRHIYDECPFMKQLLDTDPEEIPREQKTKHNCEDHE